MSTSADGMNVRTSAAMGLDSPNIDTLDAWAYDVKKVEKPWGHELIWALTDSYCGKLLFVEAGHALSLQLHERKDETIHLQSGSVELEVGGSRDELAVELVEEGASFRLRPGTVHRLRALTDAVVLE